MIYKAEMPESWIPETWARIEWCQVTFGPPSLCSNWWYHPGCLCFRDEKDYMLFLLRWS